MFAGSWDGSKRGFVEPDVVVQELSTPGRGSSSRSPQMRAVGDVTSWTQAEESTRACLGTSGHRQ